MSTTTWTIINVAPMTPTMNLSLLLAPSRRKSSPKELEAFKGLKKWREARALDSKADSFVPFVQHLLR